MNHLPDAPPCRPMRPLLDAAADGKSRGIALWYARLHAARCPGCGRYLASLREIVSKLRGSSEPEDDEAVARLAKKLKNPPET